MPALPRGQASVLQAANCGQSPTPSSLTFLPGSACLAPLLPLTLPPRRRSSLCRPRSAACWPPCSAGRGRPTCWLTAWMLLTRRRRGRQRSATAASRSRSISPPGPPPRRCVGVVLPVLPGLGFCVPGGAAQSVASPGPLPTALWLAACIWLTPAPSFLLPCRLLPCPPAGGQGAADPAGGVPGGGRPAGSPAGGRSGRGLCLRGRGGRHAISAHGGGAAGDGCRHLQRAG